MIHFKKIRFKNITSFGNTQTEIQLDRSPSTVVIGANGSGKSSAILDTISFALFGKPFRKIKKDKLVSTKNSKECIVEIEFSKFDKEYLIRRGLKPNVFEIQEDGKMLNQNAAVRDQQAFLESQILNMNFDSACQIVLVGKAQHTMFMNMSASERRKFVECVLNLTIFSNMAKIYSTKNTELKNKINELKTAVVVSSEKIETRKQYIHDLESADREQAETRKITLENQKKEILVELEAVTTKIGILEKGKPEFDSEGYAKSTKDFRELENLKARMRGRLDDLMESLEKLEKSETCSLCGQVISQDDKKEHIEDHKEKISKIQKALDEINLKIQACRTRIDELEEKKSKVDAWNSEVGGLNYESRSLKEKIWFIDQELSKGIVDHSEKIASEKKDLKKLETINSQLRAKLDELFKTADYMAMIGAMLKDTGIKTALIKKFIPIINYEVNKYLQKLGLFATFTLDENFDETIKASGFNDLGYNSFSEGEKLRIDMALLLAWRHIAKMQGNVSSNLFVLDEIADASMDQEGISALTDSLKLMEDMNVFVVTHNPEKMMDSFRSVLKFEKVEGFSRIATS